jgi:hypothetical protein
MGQPIPAQHTIGTTTKRIELPTVTRTRRALIRFQAARVTGQIIRELIAQPEPRHGRPPAHVRLDALTERYAALGGNPADLLGRRRTSGRRGKRLRSLRGLAAARHDEWLRRELDAGQSARAHRQETGGDFSILP